MSKLTIRNNYATIPNNFLNREDISLKAKGLFAYLQSKPDNWQFSKERIALQLKEGLASIKSAFAELKKHGYLKTVPQKDDRGKFMGWDYILDDNPSDGKTVGTEIGLTENHTDISKKELSKKELNKKELVIAKNTFLQDNPEIKKYIPLIIEQFRNINPMIKYQNKTERKACQELIGHYGGDKTMEIVIKAIEIQGEPYSPTITTPAQLRNNLGKLITYLKKKKTEKTNSLADLT